MKISELPFTERELALLRQKECKLRWTSKTTDDLDDAFDWLDTKEGHSFWEEWHDRKPSYTDNLISNLILKEEPKHYDNSKGSLYKFCDEHELNSYEFDIIKRVMRCRKKGLFLEDLEKTKFLIDLYIIEEITDIIEKKIATMSSRGFESYYLPIGILKDLIREIKEIK